MHGDFHASNILCDGFDDSNRTGTCMFIDFEKATLSLPSAAKAETLLSGSGDHEGELMLGSAFDKPGHFIINRSQDESAAWRAFDMHYLRLHHVGQKEFEY
jgi:Ser/Thr protein kinase RdoA (MazF antagonist)